MSTSFKLLRSCFGRRRGAAGGFAQHQSVGAGFTLIEMLVVSAIILIITTFIIFQQARFNSATLLRSLTYSVALSVRQAQVYGSSVRGVTTGGNTSFGSGYGIFVSPASACASGSSGSCYYMFSDSTSGSGNDGRRAADGTEDVIPPSPYSLGKGYIISKLCVQSGGVVTCTDSASPIASLNVFFRRPNPDACFSTDLVTNTCGPGQTPQYSAAYIQLKSTGNNETRSIKISSTGQIAVCSPDLVDLTQC